MTDPRIDAVIRHDMQNVYGYEFDEWKDKRPRAYGIRVADTRRWLAAADAVDPIRHAFEDFVIYIQSQLDTDAREGVSPQSTEEYEELVSPILARCEALTEEWFV